MPAAKVLARVSSKRLDIGYDPYIDLANAIVCLAVDDYRIALRQGDDAEIEALEEWFHSSWFEMLTNLDPDLLIRNLKAELKEV